MGKRSKERVSDRGEEGRVVLGWGGGVPGSAGCRRAYIKEGVRRGEKETDGGQKIERLKEENTNSRRVDTHMMGGLYQ